MAVGIEAISSKYALTQAIGTGAMGTVYEATQLSLRRRVAIKVLHPQYTENAAIIKRFFREALAVSHLRSRYVVRVFDSDVSPAGAPFIVMDRLEGCDLAARLRQGSIETTTVVDWTIQVCSAMNEAHRRGIVRRDLKPSNLFLVGDGTIRVLDFGISKFTEGGVLTAGSQILGTPAYIAPEVLRGHQATAQSDLWAIGVIAYKALSGHLPCEAERPDATGIAAMFATLSMPVTPLRHYRPDLPEGLCNAIMKGLVKDPEHRYLSAKDLAIELVPFGSNAEYFEDFTDDELGRLIRDSSAAVPPFADRDGAMARWRDGAMARWRDGRGSCGRRSGNRARHLTCVRGLWRPCRAHRSVDHHARLRCGTRRRGRRGLHRDQPLVATDELQRCEGGVVRAAKRRRDRGVCRCSPHGGVGADGGGATQCLRCSAGSVRVDQAREARWQTSPSGRRAADEAAFACTYRVGVRKPPWSQR